MNNVDSIDESQVTGIASKSFAETENVMSLSAEIMASFDQESDRNFHILDIVEKTGRSESVIRKALCRLSSDRRGLNPIFRVNRGFYRFNKDIGDPALQALIHFGCWRVENLRFVTKGAQGVSESQKCTADPDDQSKLKPFPGYPWPLPTGQEVIWGEYCNGTQEIRISANKKHPLSPSTSLNFPP